MNLVIPWLAPADQAKVFPNGLKFESPAEQEKYVREWAAKRTGFDCNFKACALMSGFSLSDNCEAAAKMSRAFQCIN